MKRFTLKIELGNDAMTDAHDISQALREVADSLDNERLAYVARYGPRSSRATIFDANGNTVGYWNVTRVHN